MKRIILYINLIILMLLCIGCTDSKTKVKDEFINLFKETYPDKYNPSEAWYNIKTTDNIRNIDNTRSKNVSRDITGLFYFEQSRQAFSKYYTYNASEELFEDNINTRKRTIKAENNDEKYYREDTCYDLLNNKESKITYGLNHSLVSSLETTIYSLILCPEYYEYNIENGVFESLNITKTDSYWKIDIVMEIINNVEYKRETYEIYFNSNMIVEKLNLKSSYSEFSNLLQIWDSSIVVEITNAIDINPNIIYEYENNLGSLLVFSQDDFINLNI